MGRLRSRRRRAGARRRRSRLRSRHRARPAPRSAPRRPAASWSTLPDERGVRTPAAAPRSTSRAHRARRYERCGWPWPCRDRSAVGPGRGPTNRQPRRRSARSTSPATRTRRRRRDPGTAIRPGGRSGRAARIGPIDSSLDGRDAMGPSGSRHSGRTYRCAGAFRRRGRRHPLPSAVTVPSRGDDGHHEECRDGTCGDGDQPPGRETERARHGHRGREAEQGDERAATVGRGRRSRRTATRNRRWGVLSRRPRT